ncbi:hypothetical protein CPB83DRAFT_891223 [Crepidotus variabilis]|uniref:Uncharacterized protein n=1 Tax=Crepidotus variabilis TaxID=179855 RepID=A0A9P6ENK3_9AGAR|nr:hypothetical protein CPB83DRAFT_891223 [Crepidotus variabilis]
MSNSPPPLKNRSLLQSWLALPPKTRLMFSWGMVFVGGVGWAVSAFVEKQTPPEKKTLQ